MKKETEYKQRQAPSFFSDQLPKEKADKRFSTDSIAEKKYIELSRDNKDLFRFRERQ